MAFVRCNGRYTVARAQPGCGRFAATGARRCDQQPPESNPTFARKHDHGRRPEHDDPTRPIAQSVQRSRHVNAGSLNWTAYTSTLEASDAR